MNRYRVNAELFAIVLVSIVVFSCNNPKRDIKNPKTKTIKEKNRFDITSETDKGILSEKSYYNANGTLQKSVSYSDFGIDSTVFSYNDKMQMHKKISVIDGESTVTEFQYNAEGNLAEEKWYRQNGQGEIIKYVYDNQGNRAQEIHHNLDGKIDFSRVVERSYNNKSAVLTEKRMECYTDGTENLIQYIGAFTYNEKDSLFEKLSLSTSGDVEYKTKFIYNSKGLVEEEFEFGYLNDIHSVTKYEYDEHGNEVRLLQSYCDKDGKIGTPYYERKSKYNEFGYEQQFVSIYFGEGDSSFVGARFEYVYFE